MLTSDKNEDSYVFPPERNRAEFNYMPEEEVTFSLNFRRYENLYKTDWAKWPDHDKVRSVQRKLHSVKHTKFVNYILLKKQPKKPNDLTLLSEVFSPKSSLFHKIWKSMNLVKI